ncbi:Mur ligase family protein [Streptomyces sp. NPDC093681]|uniref:Mur ligase family protein n=1 Tax=unclassified Streptomyces TaxID=2593676 RepID=UPI001BAF5060
MSSRTRSPDFDTAHIAESGTQDKVAQAKGGIAEALPANGLTVLNAPHFTAVAKRADARVITYGLDAPSASVSPRTLSRARAGASYAGGSPGEAVSS